MTCSNLIILKNNLAVDEAWALRGKGGSRGFEPGTAEEMGAAFESFEDGIHQR